MDRADFVDGVHDALTHLYDRAHLAEHPLGRCLSRDGSQLPPDVVRRLLLQAIEQMQPYAGAPSTSTGWRHHRYLQLRYLEGMSHEAVARALGLSLRQAHRVRLSAVDAVAARLWEGSTAKPSQPTKQTVGQSAPPRGGPTSSTHLGLDDELARYGREPADAPADLAHEASRALEETRPLIDGRSITVDLRSAERPLSVAAGRSLLRQAIVLLLSYAVERQTGGRVDVLVGGEGHDAILDVVFVGNSGERVGTAGEHGPLLDTARRLTEAQGGSLEALSVQGGTCLRLRLPLDRTAVVLVVDDNPDLARLFGAYLRGKRYRVMHAKTARSALRLASQVRPDVITLDVMMPFQDGWEIFRQLRGNALTRAIPVVVCSILPEKELALSLGAADFLAKPVTAQGLLVTLDRCLESRPTGRQGSP